MTKTSETRTRAAADLAQQLAAQTETARGLALALETLTAAGDLTEAGAHNAAANRPQAAAVLQALADQLDRMQRAADQLETLTTAAAQPTVQQRREAAERARLSPADDQSGAALCAQDADQTSAAAYTLDSGETLADFARRVQQLTPEQLDQISDGSGAALPDQTGKGGAAQ